MESLVDKVMRAIADHYDDDAASYAEAAAAILEEIKPAVISMFHVMEQPGMPPLTPEERWEAMVRDMQEDDE